MRRTTSSKTRRGSRRSKVRASLWDSCGRGIDARFSCSAQCRVRFGQRRSPWRSCASCTSNRSKTSACRRRSVLEQVFISYDGSNDDDAVRRANGMVARVRDGADLKAEATLAGSQLQDLGAIPVEDCRPELKTALANIEDGDVTDPLVVPGGVAGHPAGRDHSGRVPAL